MRGRGLWVLLAFVLSACSSFYPAFDEPTVTVTGFQLRPSQGTNPEFVIDLHVINPNRQALKLQGLAYSATIEGHKVLSGVSNQLPEVAAYGEADISLTAKADLLGSFRLLNDLMRKQRDGLRYALTIKLDVGDYWPAIHLTEQGEIGFSASVVQ